MRTNIELTNKSELLSTILEKIEQYYSDDISLLICYGSYITGEYGSLSDIDFYFVPKTKKGFELNFQFILNDIGYDLWPVSWERLTRIANLDEVITSILMDGVVLYAQTDDDLQKLTQLKNQLKSNLADDEVVKRKVEKYLNDAKAQCFNLANKDGEGPFSDTLSIIELLLFVIAMLNGAYPNKGIKNAASELSEYEIKPVNFLDRYGQMIKMKEKADVVKAVNALILDTEKLVNDKFRNSETADPSELQGFYEEFKSAYNKLLQACDEEDYEKAYYAANGIDKETQAILSDFLDVNEFPVMIVEVLGSDFSNLQNKCVEHENKLVKYLSANHVKVNQFKDLSDFKREFLTQDRD